MSATAINDAHCHFFSARFFASLAAQRAPSGSGTASDISDELQWELPDASDALADRWLGELDAHHAYRAALMNLDGKALRGPEMLQAFVQLRKFAGWMDPLARLLHYSINLPKLFKGEMGMLLMGGFAQGVIRSLGGKLDDLLITSSPHDGGNPSFVLNADSMIFWKRSEPELIAGQQLLARLMMQKDVQEKYSQTTGSLPARLDADLSGPGWTEDQRAASAARAEAIKSGRMLMSFAHNMALPNHIASAMIDVVTEFVHNDKMSPEQAVERMATAAENARG